MPTFLRAPATIIAWMTVVPLRVPGPVGRAEAGRALSWLPAAGFVVGIAAALIAWALSAAGASPLLAATLVVTALALLTRGMHLDGLADVVDALASYRPAEEACEVLRSGPVGPLGAAALALVSIVDAAAYAQLIAADAFVAVAAVGVVSRCLPPLLCRRSLPAAPGGGFGPLVASTQGPLPLTANAAVSLVAAIAAGAALGAAPGGIPVGWAIAASVVITTVVWGCAEIVGRHIVRRLGGISGDALGAVIAGGATLTAAGLAVLAG